MQSSYQFHFGTSAAAPVFGGAGGGLWGTGGTGDQGGSGGGAPFSLSGMIGEVGCYEKQASSVKEYAYTEDKNFRYRPTMEDSKNIKVLIM